MENITNDELTSDIEVQLHRSLMCARKLKTGSPMLKHFIKMAIVELEDIKGEIEIKENASVYQQSNY